MTNLEQHLTRQMAFSGATYGPGERRKGVCDHIRKEIEKEILKDGVDAAEAATEFVDLVLLSLDGLWRALEASGVEWERIPYVATQMITAKQGRNEQRVWPDWRTMSADKAIEHDRTVPEVAS